jgi:hypothetical protein
MSIGTLRCSRCHVMEGEHDKSGLEFELWDVTSTVYELVCNHCIRPKDIAGLSKTSDLEAHKQRGIMFATRNEGLPLSTPYYHE